MKMGEIYFHNKIMFIFSISCLADFLGAVSTLTTGSPTLILRGRTNHLSIHRPGTGTGHSRQYALSFTKRTQYRFSTPPPPYTHRIEYRVAVGGTVASVYPSPKPNYSKIHILFRIRESDALK